MPNTRSRRRGRSANVAVASITQCSHLTVFAGPIKLAGERCDIRHAHMPPSTREMLPGAHQAPGSSFAILKNQMRLVQCSAQGVPLLAWKASDHVQVAGVGLGRQRRNNSTQCWRGKSFASVAFDVVEQCLSHLPHAMRLLLHSAPGGGDRLTGCLPKAFLTLATVQE